jgi:hypothetical protein
VNDEVHHGGEAREGAAPEARRADRDSSAVVWLIGMEPELSSLLAEWLHEAGLRAAMAHVSEPPVPADLIVVDIPFPRRGLPPQVRAVARACPDTPLLALSSTLLAGVDPHGLVARHLGVHAVLATPVERETWLAEVARLLERRR